MIALTSEQLEVVTHIGHALLSACPGSGKTRTVAAKIAQAISNRKSGNKRWILAITHTNVAAEEILSRLDKAGIEASQVWVGTVHSFCLEWVLKPYAGSDSRISHGFRVINEYEQRRIEEEIKRSFSISGWDRIPLRLGSNLELPTSIPEPFLSAAKGYHEKLENERLLDFELILTLACRVLCQFDAVGARLGQLFELLIVDEYQDLSQQQYDIVSSITQHGRTQVLLVGDIDQAIYTTLGAVVKERAQLESQLKISAITEFTLSGCFRSAQGIIDFYRSFQDRPIEIRSRLPDNNQGCTVTYQDDLPLSDLAPYIAALILQYVTAGIKEDEIIVLAPQWPDASRLGREVQALLPHIYIESPNSMPLPRSFENHWYSLIRLHSTPAVPDNYSRRQRVADSVCNDLRQMRFDIDVYRRPRRAVISAINRLRRPAKEPISEYVGQIVYEFCELMGLQLDDNPDASRELLGLQDAIKARVGQLDLLDDATQLSRSFLKQSGIRVASYHSTKGEEYEVVIATGLLNGKVPHWNDIIDRNAAHSDYVARRLLYVACSRAKHHLHLISEVGHKTRRGAILAATPQVRSALNRTPH